jgi:hypothetical protein
LGLVVAPAERHFRVAWRGADPHSGFESCLFELLRRWEQVCLDVYCGSRPGSKGPGDDLRRSPLNSSNRVEHGAASVSALPSGYVPRGAPTEHLPDNHRAVYLSQVDHSGAPC